MIFYSINSILEEEEAETFSNGVNSILLDKQAWIFILFFKNNYQIKHVHF